MANVNDLITALETFSTVDNEMQLPTILAFLYVARRGECTQKDIEVELRMTNATASRNISYWTDRRFDRRPGIGFIERREDDHDRRYKALKLNTRGRSFYEKLLGEDRHGKTSRKQVDR